MKWQASFEDETLSNDTGLEIYHSWWSVSDGVKKFKCDSEADANWLAETLNKMGQ